MTNVCVQDIKPTHSKHSRARDAAAGGGFDDGDDDADGGDDDDDELRVWNLRKCSAAALDMLSNHLNDEEMLPLLLPIVQQRLADQDWRVGGACCASWVSTGVKSLCVCLDQDWRVGGACCVFWVSTGVKCLVSIETRSAGRVAQTHCLEHAVCFCSHIFASCPV
jgi:hypothetical protein